MGVRIDLVDPGPEGVTLEGGLRAAGFDVVLRPMGEVARTQADALLLAGDMEGALDALRRLRDDGASPDTPVVLLGTPMGTGHLGEGAGFGAQAVLIRPIVLGRLVDTLERLLARPGAIGATSSVMASSRRHERTMQLDASTDESAAEQSGIVRGDRRSPDGMPLAETGADPLAQVSEIAVVPGPAPSPTGTPGTGPGESASPSSTGLFRGQAASISDHLRSVLMAADRRAFPGRPPADLALPGGDDSAAELVPGELFERGDLGLDGLPDEDPIDAFTFVGGPVLPSALAPESGSEPAGPAEEEAPARKTSPGTPTSLSRRPGPRETAAPPQRPATAIEPPDGWESPAREQGWESPVREQGTGVQAARVRPSSAPPGSRLPAPRRPSAWPDEDSVLGRITPDGARRGSLGEGGTLRLVLRLAELQLDARVVITPADGEPVAMTVGAGELLAIEGPAAARALAIARRRGVRLLAASDEASAARALDEAVERGAMSMFERDRALREGRQRLLGEIVSSSRATFSLARLDPHELPARGVAPLGAPLRAAIIEAARGTIDPARARAVLGGTVALRRGARFDALAADGLIAPEIALLLVREEGETLDRLLELAPDEPGLVGLVCALVAAGALQASVVAAPDPAPTDRARLARRVIEDAARLASDGDYFAVLGVARDASPRDIAHAHRRRVEQLRGVALDELGLAALEPLRREALDAVADAHRILAVPRWRDAYAEALTASPDLAGQVSEH